MSYPPPPRTPVPPRRTSRATIVALTLLILFAMACLGAWWYRYTGTPEYSLSQLGHAVRAKNYGEASKYVDEERIANAISQSLTEVLLAKYTQKFKDDPLPFTDTRIELLHKMAPRFHDWSLLGIRNAIRLLLSGNGLLTGSTGFTVLDEHNFSGLHPVRSTVGGDTADVVIVGLPQPNPFDLNEIHIRMVRIPGSREWRIEEIPDATPIFARYFNSPVPPVQP
ncbi:MAG TPA: hypothetical protein VII29_19115 [Terriglobales bacterium]